MISQLVDVLNKRKRTDIKFVVTLPEDKYNMLFHEKYRQSILNVGFVPSKEGPSLYKECDIMFLPTLLECFSASFAEAMVMRKPIITSDMGFAHCVCKDAAVYFNPVNPMDIADKLLMLVDNKSLQATLVEKGVGQLKQFGTSSDRVDAILKLCKSLVRK